MFFGFVPLNGHNFRFECNEEVVDYIDDIDNVNHVTGCI